jgi:myo-inositol-1(or 4)-monophosphatase
MESLKALMQRSRGIRRLGSAAMDLAYVACGRFDGFFEHGLNAWDVAAGAYIVEKAGGRATDFAGRDNYLFGREILASNLHIHEELQTFFK